MAESNEFYEKWNNYLANVKIVEVEIGKANEMDKTFENKIPIFKKKLKKFTFNENLFNFIADDNQITENSLGEIEISSIGKIDLEDDTCIGIGASGVAT